MTIKEYNAMTNNYLIALVASYRDKLTGYNEDLEDLYNALLALPGRAKASDQHLVQYNKVVNDMTVALDNYKSTGILVEAY